MKCCLLLVYGLYLDDVREQVHRLPTRCVSSTYIYIYIHTHTHINYRCFGLEKLGWYKALGLDPKDH